MIEKNDSAETIPVSIIEMAVRNSQNQPEKYTPSYVARLINRSIKSDFQKDLPTREVRRGHFTRMDPLKFFMTIPDVGFQYQGPFVTLNYKGMTFPGLSYGQEIQEELDKKVLELTKKEISSGILFKIAAFVTSGIGNSHAFFDGNGRAATGSADFVLRKYGEQKLNYPYIARRSKELSEMLSLIGYLLLPDKYHPKVVLANMYKQGKDEGTIEIPDLKKGVSEVEFRTFVNDFAASQKDFIMKYDPDISTNDELDPRFYIDELAKYYYKFSTNLDGSF